MPKNRERFVLAYNQCQGCGTGISEDDGLLCDDCKKDIGPNWKQWLEVEQINEDEYNGLEDYDA